MWCAPSYCEVIKTPGTGFQLLSAHCPLFVSPDTVPPGTPRDPALCFFGVTLCRGLVWNNQHNKVTALHSCSSNPRDRLLCSLLRTQPGGGLGLFRSVPAAGKLQGSPGTLRVESQTDILPFFRSYPSCFTYLTGRLQRLSNRAPKEMPLQKSPTTSYRLSPTTLTFPHCE